jgi:hypothetical protein
MIPDATEDDYERDAERDYAFAHQFNLPWIRRAVAAEKRAATLNARLQWSQEMDKELGEEIDRLRAALEREYNRLQSLGRAMTHYEGCDGSQEHAICYAMRLIREALNHPPRTSTPAQQAEA